jgi:hypothetical protein
LDWFIILSRTIQRMQLLAMAVVLRTTRTYLADGVASFRLGNQREEMDGFIIHIELVVLNKIAISSKRTNRASPIFLSIYKRKIAKETSGLDEHGC